MKIGINGFGRMGHLALRAGWDHPELEFVAINEPHASADTLALLQEFDSVQGRWSHSCTAPSATQIKIDKQTLALSRFTSPSLIPWAELGVDVVLECSGQFRTTPLLTAHLDRGAKKVIVSVPVMDGPPNIVVGVNDHEIDFAAEPIVTAASCTTNCLAPVARVIHDGIGIERGLITTIHNPTNTQSVTDAPHKDPRRARAAQQSLIPTSTNSASAVTMIIPELEGKLDSIAVRAPVLNASLIDCAFQMQRNTSTEEVNALFEAASKTAPLQGILGYETRPLVSCDYARDPRSAIIDALSTRTVAGSPGAGSTGAGSTNAGSTNAGSMVKVLAWYDNEWGYANRMIDILLKVQAAIAD